MCSTGNNKNINDRLSTSNSSFLKQNYRSKRRKLMSTVDESSSSEDIEIVCRRRKTTVKALSDYESGESDGEIARFSLPCFSRGNKKEVIQNATTKNVCRDIVQFKDSSSSSDSDELIIRLSSRRGSMRALSDYETGDSIDHAGEPLLNLSGVDKSFNNSTNSSQQNDEIQDSSSESDSMHKVTCKRSRNLLSTSDSSDSDSPVKQQRFRKRKRINTSSEESGEENVITSHSCCIEFLESRIERKRQLRTNQRRYIETESDSSSDEMLKTIIDNIIEQRPNPTNNIGSDSSSFSNDQVIRRDHLTANERSTESTHHSIRTPAIKSTRRLRPSNNGIGMLRIPLSESESETSSDDNSCFLLNSFTSSNNSLSYQNYFSSCSSDNDTVLLFEPRRGRGGSVQIIYSDSDSNTELPQPNVVNNLSTGNLNVSANQLIPSKILDESSSDSDANSERCPICFSYFGSKEVASPVSCDHSFCTKCIQEWARSNNTCPIDRKLFNIIIVRRSFIGNAIREIPVESPPPIETRFWESDLIEEDEIDTTMGTGASSSSEDDDDTCCVCYSSNNSHNLILCDFCNNCYHLRCLTPPLRFVPVSDWFCPTCVRQEMGSNHSY